MIRLDGIIDKEGYKYRSDIYIYIYFIGRRGGIFKENPGRGRRYRGRQLPFR